METHRGACWRQNTKHGTGHLERSPSRVARAMSPGGEPECIEITGDHRTKPLVGRRVSFDIPLALFLSFSDLSLAGAPDLSVLSLLSPFDACPCRDGARGVRYELQNWFLTSPIVYRSDEAPRPIAPQTADARRIVVCLCAFLAFTPTLLRSRYITVYAPPLVGSAVVRICHILIPVSLCSVSTGRAKENEAKILHTGFGAGEL